METVIERTNVELRVQRLAWLAGELGRKSSELTGGLRLSEDLGVDSLDMQSLLMAIEDCYGFMPPAERVAKLVLVDDVLTMLQEALDARA